MKRLLIAALLCLPLQAQNASPTPTPKIQFFDPTSGAPLAGGLVYTYAAGTTTPLASYTDSSASTPNTNPVTLDAGGFANIWLLNNECYKLVVQTSAGASVSSTDNICAAASQSSLNVTLASPPPIGTTLANTIVANPFYITSGSSGDTTYRALRLKMNTNAQFTGNFLANSGSLSDPLTQIYFNQWFSAGPASPSFAKGVLGVSEPLQAWLNTGVVNAQGGVTNWQMPDPTTAVATVTPQGGTGSGEDYCLYFVDSSEQTSAPVVISSSTAFSSPNGSTWNKILYNQDQGSGKYGGSYSNVCFSRIAHGAGASACPASVLNTSGNGVICQTTACNNNVTTDGQCEYDDKGTATTTLSALQGIFVGTTGYENSTGIIKNPQRSFLGFGASGGNYLAGGNQFVGRTITQQISAPSAPTVSANNSGATTYQYALVVHDYGLGSTTIGSLGQTTTGGATRNNNVSWTITAYCSSVDLYAKISGSYYTLTGSTGLPCTGANTSGGFGTPSAFTFTDNNLTTTLATPPTANTTGDITLASGSNFVSLAGNATAEFLIAASAFSGVGWCQMNTGDATHTGGFICKDHTGATIYTMGTDVDNSGNYTFASSGGTYKFTAPVDLAGGCTGCGGGGGGTVTTTGFPGSNQVATFSGPTSITGLSGTSAQVLGYGASGVPTPFMPTVYYGPLMDPAITGSGSDEYTAVNAALTTISGNGGGILQLPCSGNYTKVGTDLTLPANVGLRGCGMESNQQNISIVPPGGLQFTGNGSSTSFHLNLVNTGVSQLQDLALKDTSASGTEGMVIVTAATPKIVNVSCRGRANTSNSDGSSHGTNDCIQFGSSSTTCTAGSTTSNYCGYSPGVVFNFNAINCQHVLYFLNAANGIHADNINSDSTCGIGNGTNATGYAIELAGTTGSGGNAPYGNVIGPLVTVEQGGYPTFPPVHPNYAGAIGLTGFANDNHIEFATSDVGDATHGAYITTTNASTNYIQCNGIFFSGGCISDTGASSFNNTLFDVPNRTLYVQSFRAGNIGSASLPTNFLFLYYWKGQEVTISALDASPVRNEIGIVSNSVDGTCVNSGGSIRVVCRYNGSGWVPIDDLSSPTLGSPNIGTATGTSLILTGTLSGKVPVTIDTSSPVALGTTNQTSSHINENATLGGAMVYNLPVAAAGRRHCVTNGYVDGSGPDTGTLKLQTSALGQFVNFAGSQSTSDGYIISTGAAGDSVCLLGIDATHWQVDGTPVGSWSVH